MSGPAGSAGPARPGGGLLDLSHAVEDGLLTYPGLPAPVISEHMTREASRARYEPGTEFQIGRIEMVANTGTYLDSPFHRFDGGCDLADLPLESLADLEGIVIRARGRPDRALGPGLLGDAPLAGRAVLVDTGWDARWGTPEYFEGHPFLTAAMARALVAGRARLVGIDSLNIDDTAGGARPVHTALLRAGIPVVEHLCRLDGLPDQGFRFFAVPARVRAFGSFPVRAFARLDGPRG